MDSFIALQRWLYGGMAETMRAANDLSGAPTLLALAFVFGIVHAVMPGHGKTVLVSYHLGRAGRALDGLITGSLLALTHVGSAILFVAAGVAVISRAVAAAGRTPAFETASGVLIALTGAYLIFRAVRPLRHSHAVDGRMLAVATGLVPCPLTTFILTYSLARGKLALGLVAVCGMLAGVILTLVTFAVSAVVARGRFVKLLARTEVMRDRLGGSLELAGALGVFVLGIAMLATRI